MLKIMRLAMTLGLLASFVGGVVFAGDRADKVVEVDCDASTTSPIPAVGPKISPTGGSPARSVGNDLSPIRHDPQTSPFRLVLPGTMAVAKRIVFHAESLPVAASALTGCDFGAMSGFLPAPTSLLEVVRASGSEYPVKSDLESAYDLWGKPSVGAYAQWGKEHVDAIFSQWMAGYKDRLGLLFNYTFQDREDLKCYFPGIEGPKDAYWKRHAQVISKSSGISLIHRGAKLVVAHCIRFRGGNPVGSCWAWAEGIAHGLALKLLEHTLNSPKKELCHLQAWIDALCAIGTYKKNKEGKEVLITHDASLSFLIAEMELSMRELGMELSPIYDCDLEALLCELSVESAADLEMGL
jgi:hypothetical protein